jgi:hypothetical protein
MLLLAPPLPPPPHPSTSRNAEAHHGNAIGDPNAICISGKRAS